MADLSHFSEAVEFTGTFRHRLDPKHRMTVPASWRYAADTDARENRILKHEGGFLVVLPPWQVAPLRQQLKAVSILDEEMQENLAYFYGELMVAFSVDSQGRCTLSEDLRQHARIEGEIVFVAAGATYRIYSPEAHAAFIAKRRNTDVARRLLSVQAAVPTATPPPGGAA